MFKPILVWFGFLAVVRYQTLFLEEAKDISKFLSGTLQSKGPLKKEGGENKKLQKCFSTLQFLNYSKVFYIFLG